MRQTSGHNRFAGWAAAAVAVGAAAAVAVLVSLPGDRDEETPSRPSVEQARESARAPSTREQPPEPAAPSGGPPSEPGPAAPDGSPPVSPAAEAAPEPPPAGQAEELTSAQPPAEKAPVARGDEPPPPAAPEPEEAPGEHPAAATAPPEDAPVERREDGPAAPPQEKTWSRPRFTERTPEREAMVRVIRRYGLTDREVLDAMLAVPRHEFVLPRYLRSAYADTPLPIGHGQTISQPYIVAEMTRQLRLRPDSRVLEIGTGSGYQAAVLTEFTPHVYSIEIVKPLAEVAKKRLSRLGYHVVQLREGDGYHGWPEEAPFDAIIVTCAAGQIPPPLIRQLRPGGRMIIPVGGRFAAQWLMLVEKDADGKVRSRSLMGVRFVPFVRS